MAVSSPSAVASRARARGGGGANTKCSRTPGVATTLYTEERAERVEGLRNALAAGGPIEHLFSRKRSLVRGIKKRRRRAEEQRRAGRRSY